MVPKHESEGRVDLVSQGLDVVQGEQSSDLRADSRPQGIKELTQVIKHGCNQEVTNMED